MTLRELHTCVATDNHATFTLEKFGYRFPLENVHWDEIGNRYKNSEVWMAYPVEASCCSVKKWKVMLK